jgi:hypothetical protein
MDVFDVHGRLIADYDAFTSSLVQVREERIAGHLADERARGPSLAIHRHIADQLAALAPRRQAAKRAETVLASAWQATDGPPAWWTGHWVDDTLRVAAAAALARRGGRAARSRSTRRTAASRSGPPRAGSGTSPGRGQARRQGTR